MRNLLRPIFRLLPSRGLRYVPLRPIAEPVLRSVAIAPTPKGVKRAQAMCLHSNQIPS